MSLTLYGVNFFLDQVFGSMEPATLYVALMRDEEPTYLTTGSGLDEPSGGSYERVAVPNDLIHWPESADGLKSNGLDIVFPTATGSWGIVRSWAILDAPTGGNIIIWGGASARRVASGTTLRLPTDTLTITTR